MCNLCGQRLVLFTGHRSNVKSIRVFQLFRNVRGGSVLTARWHLRLFKAGQRKQAVMFAQFLFLPYLAVTEQHYHSFGAVLVHLVDVSIHSLFISVFGCTNC